MKHRVVITGIGALTPMGHGVEGIRAGLRARKSRVTLIEQFNTQEFSAKCAAQILDYEPTRYFPPHRLKRIDKYAQFCLVVTRQAMEDAGIAPCTEAPSFDIGVSFGTALGGITNAESQHARFLSEGVKAIPASLALQVFGGSAHTNIAIANGFRGYNTTNSNSCASGTVSVGEAYRVLRDGLARVMIAGSSETPLAPLTFGAFDVIKTMSRETNPALACRPFDRRRGGFVMAEGATAMVLETEEHALQRGARIYAEVLGYSLNNDAYHMTSSLPDGAAAIDAMSRSLKEAGLRPDQIGYINAHASSTPMNDEHEQHAITKLFGSNTPPVSGTKAFYGHPLGAAGGIEAAICALSIADEYLPETLNCEEPDIAPGFDLILGEPRHTRVNYVLSNSFGFGGINATLVLGRYGI
ncbi:beta-ketoacyl-[acyl-carrier-protein] synthase II [Verrucomicrobia bacterium LW23]|nr:beta-ketoacyl-[acyl-carrier-protein] synthase II [Verrucomicrobia bacterium LW23]